MLDYNAGQLKLIDRIQSTWLIKKSFPHMQEKGVIMDVTNEAQAQIAEQAGAVAVMLLDKLPYDIRQSGGIARTASVNLYDEIREHISIPIMMKCRIGHIGEARILEAAGVDTIDESEVLTPADTEHHIWKHDFKIPFVCGCTDLGSALRRIEEGASMLRSKGEPGTGDVKHAIVHFNKIKEQLRLITASKDEPSELIKYSREFKVSYDIIQLTANMGRLPITIFAAGGISSPADAAFMMSLGCDGIFVGSGIFKATDPQVRAESVVLATSFWDDPEIVLKAQKMVSEDNAMGGIDMETKPSSERWDTRGSDI
ncbi:MAG: pyridoxal 5'-phosphate synthase lyase subunit PdxS [Candidatus Lokiarchaeota archaeon]|nr:pyridoxal 5'-phosphate synthase lyase subunit PdxS [Candidatus Lokiarchaeota archaeon]